MRLVSVFAVLGVATAADAAPCSVAIARAPDEARATIEAWVAAEPRCTAALTVRVVGTADGGYYVHAKDGDGHVRERDVPDLQTLGVLVASWAADDGLPHVALTPAVERAPIAPESIPLIVAARAEPPRESRPLHLALSANASATLGFAVRGDAEIDVGRWFVYAAGSIGQTPLIVALGSGSVELMPRDARLAGGLGRSWSSGRWGLRVRAGAAIARWSGDAGDMTIGSTFVGGEGAALLIRALDERWAVFGGLELKKFASHTDDAGAMTIYEPAFEAGLLAGVRVRI